MSNILFTSDLHFGHANIVKHRAGIDSVEHNTDLIVADWKSTVTKRDVVYVLGDACFTQESLNIVESLPGRKILVLGNHDYDREVTTRDLLTVFNDAASMIKYREFWLSHAPIHPNELRGKINLHGHVHTRSIPDNRYFNCCVENLLALFGRRVASIQQIRKHIATNEANSCLRSLYDSTYFTFAGAVS